MTAPDERTIGKIQKIHDFARAGDTDIRDVLPQVEPFVTQTDALREAAESAGLNKRERRVLADGIARSIREGLE
jgi:hypothetical protein